MKLPFSVIFLYAFILVVGFLPFGPGFDDMVMDPKSPYVVLPVGSKIPLMNTDTLNVSPEGAVQRCSIKKLF